MNSAYIAIGRAVHLSQIFEASFTIFMEFFRMVTEPDYFRKTDGRFNEKAYKNPTKNHLNRLVERDLISDEFSKRLELLIEARHKLIHRWFHEESWPEENDIDAWNKVKEHAIEVERESREVTLLIAKYLQKHASQGKASENYEKYLKDVQEMFRNVDKHS